MRSIAFRAAVLVLVFAVPALAQVQKKDLPGILNYSRVDATVGCGGRTDPAAMTALKKEGYVAIINLRLASEPEANIDASRAAARTAGLKYFHLPFSGADPDPKVVDQFLSVVADTQNQPVFIHCATANRAGAMWMIKRVLQDHWTIDRAREEAQAIGMHDPKLAAFATDYINAHK
jgi:uncharacterized protein (TIGR01244 family)